MEWFGKGRVVGLTVALLTTLPTYMIYFVVQPMTANVVVKQIAF